MLTTIYSTEYSSGTHIWNTMGVELEYPCPPERDSIVPGIQGLRKFHTLKLNLDKVESGQNPLTKRGKRERKRI